jgi:hypothetical protein
LLVDTVRIGDAELAQVHDAGFELVLPSTGRTLELVDANRQWLAPHFVTADGSLRVGSSAVAIRSEGTTIVVDPWLAFDDPDRSTPEARARLERNLAALSAAGFAPEDVDVVVNTHVDGSGANATGDRATFPNARYLLHQAQLDELDSGKHSDDVTRAWQSLRDAKAVDGFDGPVDVTGEVRLAPGTDHAAGHTLVHVTSGDSSAVVIGHLFLHPLQLHAVDNDNGDVDPTALLATRRRVLADAARDGTVLVGPLFAPPGAGRVEADGEVWRLAVLR